MTGEMPAVRQADGRRLPLPLRRLHPAVPARQERPVNAGLILVLAIIVMLIVKGLDPPPRQ